MKALSLSYSCQVDCNNRRAPLKSEICEPVKRLQDSEESCEAREGNNGFTSWSIGEWIVNL